ncbi:MAG: endonuclease III [Gemmatimonadetes bacterium]|nr:endonuclease III [Gemmatimonadota bacterium]
MPRESKRAKRERALEVVRRLAEAYPDSRCSLDHGSPFELLAATVLSAQCTDVLVNKVTPALFAAYGTPEKLAAAMVEDIEDAIRQINFNRTKAKALKGLATVLVEQHGGEVPRSMEALTKLPGVGRKTANVVRGVGFGETDGVVVDTHVKRVSARLALTRSEDALEIERNLLDLVPPESRVAFTHQIIDHGRSVCVARKPRCEICVLNDICPSSFVIQGANLT